MGMVMEPPMTAESVSEMAIGPLTAFVRPRDGEYSRGTCTVAPKPDRPFIVTADEPAPPPKMTWTWFPALLSDAAPSMPVWAGGTVMSMLPVMPPYHRYS